MPSRFAALRISCSTAADLLIPHSSASSASAALASRLSVNVVSGRRRFGFTGTLTPSQKAAINT